jgi:hypothetical protein
VPARHGVQFLAAQCDQPSLGLMETELRDGGETGDFLLGNVEARPANPQELRQWAGGER